MKAKTLLPFYCRLVLVPVLIFAVLHGAWAETDKSPERFGLADQQQKTLESALSNNRAELEELRNRLVELEKLKRALVKLIDGQQAENTMHRQLLLMSQPRIESLEQAIRDNRLGHGKLLHQSEKLQSRYNLTSSLFVQASSHMELARKQMEEIQQSQQPAEEKARLAATANELILVLEEKKELGRRYLDIYENLMQQLSTVLEEEKKLGEELSAQLEERLKKMLFTASNPYRDIFGSSLKESWNYFLGHLRDLLNISAWQSKYRQLIMGQPHRWVIFLFWLACIMVLQARFRRALLRFDDRHDQPNWHFRRLSALLLRRSMIVLLLTLLVGSYDSPRSSLLEISLFSTVFKTLLILLITRWGLDFLQFCSSSAKMALNEFIFSRLRRFFFLLRYCVLTIVLFNWLAGRESVLTWIIWALVTTVLFLWTVVFWYHLKRVVTECVIKGQAGPNAQKIKIVLIWSYLVSGGGLLMSLTGFSLLAGHWWAGWIKTVTMIFWGYVSWKAIREWQRDQGPPPTTGADRQPLFSGYHLRWALIQLCLAAWGYGVFRGILWAWDREGALSTIAKEIFRYTYTIGTINISIRGIVLAAVILFFTNLIVRIGRALLDEKVIGNKMLEPGLKDSVLTICGYLGWSLGLLLALATLGVNATSLAVVFGALSVGIGFGLQTIFNNFISGLILLFERPIQVGDTVEINGIWAEVKKINVRATVVQTFDNASMIIPNSEFVSKQVTNWSFKDRRMRRNMDVGVAYGSNIELVEKTMLEIAHSYPNVLKYPAPEVHFIEHGDSVLLFRLRLWVQVEDYWAVPSRIRFDIDKRFRELGIEIAFPQRDIHIRSLPKEWPSPAASPSLPQAGQDALPKSMG